MKWQERTNPNPPVSFIDVFMQSVLIPFYQATERASAGGMRTIADPEDI